MKNNEKFLKKITSLKETISYEKALYLNALYKKSSYSLSKNFLPTGWHWIYFNENYKLKDISTDGHLKRGKILPAFKGYKRMYAGGKLDFKKKIRFGEILEKISFVDSIKKKIKKDKQTLYFVRQKNIFQNEHSIFLEEDQNLVFMKKNYKSNTNHFLCKSNLKKIIFYKRFNLNNIVLFRYSALTYNSHRIHYDVDYAKKQEGYKDILVHGPLLAMLVLNSLRENKLNVKMFSFKIVAPIFVNQDFSIKVYSTKEKNKFKGFLIKNRQSKVMFYCEFLSAS